MIKVGYFVTELNFGSGPGAINANLIIDTGVDQSWVQCEGCNPCFNVTSGNFKYKNSTSFQQVGLHDNLCAPQFVYDGDCGFDTTYGNAHVNGFLGKDNFNFTNNKTGLTEIYKGLAFGCVLQNNGINFTNIQPNNTILGVHGLAPGPRSFLSQLDTRIKGRFSYCLPQWTYTDKTTSTTMYFGDEAIISGDKFRIVKAISMARHAKRYHLHLSAISVDGDRLPIKASIFQLDPIGYSKGFFIDSGTPYTVLARSAYNPLRIAIAKFFYEMYGWRHILNGEFDLCYNSYPTEFQPFPMVKLHFLAPDLHGEVEMVLDDLNMFLKISEGFCMTVLPVDDPGPSIFGAFQQVNFKFLYDVNQWLLYFVPENCEEIV
ncbi:hypothetical protein RND81_09G219200 [Saponaria officinalis]|uniref:Peptidase A1 domain-containing protein n=1 Tax=Saponaria officinalis TaxID=3572 RepID=A0AAW1IQY4_SAPOF